MRRSLINLAIHYKIVVVGGGTGGCAVSNRFRKLVSKGQIAIVEPNYEHFNQSAYTLVGGGLMSLASCRRPMNSVLHPGNIWIQQSVKEINAKNNSLIVGDGSEIKYDLLIIAVGLQLRYDMVEGLDEALKQPHVCSIYKSELVGDVYHKLQKFSKGTAIFTLPSGPIKCSGAGQKICYLADEIFKKKGVRNNIQLVYNTYLNDIFDVPKYAKALNEVAKEKSIIVHLRRNLKIVDLIKKEAVFEILDTDAKATGETDTQNFNFLHVAPPCSSTELLRNTKDITDANGFLDVDPRTLQSNNYGNIFGIGDCLGSPNKKTAAAVYSQMKALSINIPAFLKGKKLTGEYNLYSSCPLIVDFKRVVLAEFTPDGPLETLPFDQGRPLRSAFILKRYILPFLYWNFGVKGNWLGPSAIRKLLRFGKN